MAKAAPKKAVEFEGFHRDGIAFLYELGLEMNRAWFEANKARYQARWAAPMAALLADVRARLAKAYAPMRLGEPKVFRIYRDTRFSSDKSPYKTHVAGMIPVREACAAAYVHVGLDETFVGVGTYFFDEAQLPRWRKLVAAERTGTEIARMIARLRKAGYAVAGHEDYKRVPKPFPADHPRAELLKMRGLTAGFPLIPRGLLHDARFADWVLKHARATAPLVKWIRSRIG